jgi:hypothetical protein
MYIANGDTITGSEANGATDWNSADIFIFRIENIANGARAQIQWKTNYPASNATNIPVVVTAPSPLGTWTVTFTDSTHGSLTGPGITATNFTLPADAVANNFSPANSYVQFGMFKNDGANDGHNNNYHGTFSNVQIQGPGASINDSFNGPLLTNNYAWRVTSPSAVQHIPNGTAWISDWTIPANGFSTESAGAVGGPWAPVAYTRTYQSAGEFHGLIPQSAFPNANTGFLRLIKRPFVKLQVLMPGETAAPNTPTGKTGTPTAQQAGFQFNVRVNACDTYWNVIPASDTVTITSSDAGASLPSDAALVGGTASFPVTLTTTTSTQTVTATDVTDNTKTANTGSSTTVTP